MVIPDEFHKDLSNLKATISMANAGPNTGTSQFFINLKDNTRLDHDKEPLTSKHAVFGKVIGDFEVVQTIEKVPTNGSDRPINKVIMDSLRIDSPVGKMEVNNNLNKFSLFPNPITSETTVNLSISNVQNLQTSLFDGLGKLVLSTNVKANAGNNIYKINNLIPVGLLSKGIYQLNINGAEINASQKIVIQ